jgi:hypothetical protein
VVHIADGAIVEGAGEFTRDPESSAEAKRSSGAETAETAETAGTTGTRDSERAELTA